MVAAIQMTYSERFGTFAGIGIATTTISLLQVTLPGSEHVAAFGMLFAR